MALPGQFLDDIRARVALSGLIGGTVKLTRAGREWKACCPFHGDKTPSFTISDEKGFAHCFGCGWHGDAFRWLQDQAGLSFMDAVRELAAQAGLEMPAPEPAAREARIASVREALEIAQGIYVGQLEQAGAVMEYLAARAIGPEEIATFGLGYARGADGSLRGRGIGAKLAIEAGLAAERDDGSLREMFHDRVTVPIHDARGRLIGFGGRTWGRSVPGLTASSSRPKWVNSPDGPAFDKGRTLFNLHRAAPASRPQAENRLLVVEGYFDVIALARAGFAAAVAPMGTALTPLQLERCWRLHNRPVLLFDGDAAGRKAAVRGCLTAIPAIGPGRELAVALLPDGKDPDDLLREAAENGGGVRAIEVALTEAAPLHTFLFDAVLRQAQDERGDGGRELTPEGIAAVWERLVELTEQIGEPETRAQYLGAWRARFERELSGLPQVAAPVSLHTVRRADAPGLDGGDYAFPDTESDSAKHLIQIVRRLLKLREERREITEDIGEVMKFAEAIGFNKVQLGAVVREIESDIAKGPGVREEAEMARVLYRRALGIRGPMNEAMLPPVADPRPKALAAGARRKATTVALLEARAMDV